MEANLDENTVRGAIKYLSQSANMDALSDLLCSNFNPDSVSDAKLLYFMKKIYSKFSKTRKNAADLLNHLEKIKSKEKEAESLKKTLLMNQSNQSKDISEMEKAIKEDISQYLRDLKTYTQKYEALQAVIIHPALVGGKQASLADYVSLKDIEESKQNLDSRKSVLVTKMEKLNQNNETLLSVIQSLKENSGEEDQEMPKYLLLLTTAYQKLKTIGRNSGLNEFDSNPDLLGKDNHDWKQSDKIQYKELSEILKQALDMLEELSASIEILANKYINLCKKNFEKLHSVNTAIGKNEGERIKTLKTYEMFKKEYKYFQTPKCLPKCYEESILEMKRREKYNRFFKYNLEKLKAIWEYENKKRDEFLNRNGLYIPKRLLPQLGKKAPFFNISLKEFDTEECPQGILGEQDKLINGIESKVYYFEKVYADIVRKIKKNPKVWLQPHFLSKTSNFPIFMI